MACLEGLPSAIDYNYVGDLFVGVNGGVKPVRKFDESTQKTLEMDDEGVLEEEGEDNEKVKTEKLPSLVLPGIVSIWSRLSVDYLHYLPPGVFDGGQMGASGVVVDSRGVNKFAPYEQQAGDDVLFDGTTCTLLGVARHCLWYVVRDFTDLEAINRTMSVSTFPSPGPRLPCFAGLEFGMKGINQSVGVGCWDRKTFISLQENDRIVLCKGGDGEDDQCEGILLGGDGDDKRMGVDEEDEREEEEGKMGEERVNGDEGLFDGAHLGSLVRGRGLWTGDLDTKLALFIERCTELCNVPSPSCLSREKLGMSEAGGLKVKNKKERKPEEGAGGESKRVTGPSRLNESERGQKEKLLTKILSQGSSRKILEEHSVQSSEAGDMGDIKADTKGEFAAGIEDKSGSGEGKYETLMSKQDKIIQVSVRESQSSDQ